jgi:hypothetical protein
MVQRSRPPHTRPRRRRTACQSFHKHRDSFPPRIPSHRAAVRFHRLRSAADTRVACGVNGSKPRGPPTPRRWGAAQKGSGLPNNTHSLPAASFQNRMPVGIGRSDPDSDLVQITCAQELLLCLIPDAQAHIVTLQRRLDFHVSPTSRGVRSCRAAGVTAHQVGPLPASGTHAARLCVGEVIELEPHGGSKEASGASWWWRWSCQRCPTVS